jgi:hypothetical protein
MGDSDITTGEQINKYLKKYFNDDEYKGIVLDDNIPELKKNQFIINNKNIHWTAVYNLNGKVKEFDSYGRDMLRNIDDTFIPINQRQGANQLDEGDCGQRTIAFLLLIYGKKK